MKKNIIHFSVIIPTLNRQTDLVKCLQSIAQNTHIPDELIIVEQGDLQKTKKACSQINLNINLIYFNKKSLSLARNRAIQASTGDILFFFDDDTVLKKNYFEEAVLYLQKHTTVMGITGKDLVYALKYKKTYMYTKRLVESFFCLSSNKKTSSVLLSGQNTLHNTSDKIEDIQWLSGCNMVIRKRVFDDGLYFNKNFIRWSFGEDVMLTYQIYKKYGSGSLRYLPRLKLYHNQSTDSRLQNTNLIKMILIYRYIFWKKELSHKKLSLLCYLHSQIGIIFIMMLKYRNILLIPTILKTYVYMFKNANKIHTDTIDYNTFILQS